MLYLVGAVAIEVWPYNVHEVTRETKHDFVEKPVIGARPPLEDVGPGAATLVLKGRLLPEKFPGGLGVHEAVHAMAEAGEAQHVLRGDGVPFGWYVIEKVSDTSTFLTRSGVGQFITFEITLKKAEFPGQAAAAGMIFGLFG